jgi:hypothetical protein
VFGDGEIIMQSELAALDDPLENQLRLDLG